MSKETKIRFNLVSVLIKPLLAGIICAVSAYVSYELMSKVLQDRLSTVLAVIIASIIYLISLFLLRALTPSDVKMLPKGDIIVKTLAKLKLIR